MEQRIIISKHLESDLAVAISECNHDGIFVLTDETTHAACRPRTKEFLTLRNAHEIVIPSGDANKSLASLTHVWEELQRGNATRHSLLINLGGGMVTDLGGFAAATFKRGINFINIPTTLLAMVDASVGGKTGINFGGMKNELGAFREASRVILDTQWLSTLNARDIRSGFAEMLKHALLADEKTWATLLRFDLEQPDLTRLAAMLAESIAVKARIVSQDPQEKGLRKALNLGHTFGHAIEEWSLGHEPLPHGYAVAYGLVCELYLSAVRTGFPTDKMRQTVAFIRDHYGAANITCDDYDRLIDLMRHDKKTRQGEINATLLADFGRPCIDQCVADDEAREALDFLREGA